MKKIDIYIIKKYLTTFFFTVLLISGVAIVIDFAEKIEKITGGDIPISEVLFDYYLHFIPWINGILWPLFALLSVIFFTSRLASDTEIVSMLSAKISYYRILRPVMIAATIIATLLWYGDNYLIPKSTKLKTEFENTHKWHKSEKTLSNNIHFFLNPSEKIYIRYYRKRDTTGHDFRLERFENNKLTYTLKADIIRLKEAPNLWSLENYEKRIINGLDERLVVGAEGNNVLDTVFNFSAADFSRYTNAMVMMSSTDLKAFIDAEKSRGIGTTKKYEIELHRRSADPFTILILSLIGFAIASRKVRGGTGLNLALGILLGSVFVILSKFTVTFASNMSLPPLIGMWLPNVVFLIIAIFLVLRAQK